MFPQPCPIAGAAGVSCSLSLSGLLPVYADARPESFRIAALSPRSLTVSQGVLEVEAASRVAPRLGRDFVAALTVRLESVGALFLVSLETAMPFMRKHTSPSGCLRRSVY